MRAILTAAGLAVLAAFSARADSFAELPTVFYGKIVATGGGRPFLLSEGKLVWTIRRADGLDIILATQLRPLNDGEYSYRMAVPHQAVALGLSASASTVPLGIAPETQTVLGITVDGQAAHILGPNGSTFNTAEAMRAATYRLDLEVLQDAADSNANGLPDWWEAQYGLNDPNGDPDGDGRNNLAEYLAGTDPKRDDRSPALATRGIRAYAEGTTLVLLDATDADSDPTNLFYTLVTPPEAGTLYLRNRSTAGTNSDGALAAGDTFTQADINGGRLIFDYRPGGPAASSTAFTVALRDETPTHPAATNSISVDFYEPTQLAALAGLTLTPDSTQEGLPVLNGVPSEEQPFVAGFLLSRDLNFIVCDGSAEARPLDVNLPSSGLSPAQYQADYVASYGHDRRHLILGGPGSDRLSGSMEDDIIIGGPGNDSLRGNGGRDVFVLTSSADGNDTIEDFNVSENDAIDVSRVLVGASDSVTNYLLLTNDGTNSYLRLNYAGEGTGFTNQVIMLAGKQFVQSDLRTLVENGNVLTGTKVFPPRVSVIASSPAASENGPQSGEFTLTRAGGAETPLTVNLRITGSAQNGVDYEFIDSQLTFPAGQREMTIPVNPYVDTQTEMSEVVQIAVLSGEGYEVGPTASAQVTIEDLAPQISIEALDGLADLSALKAGVLLISRAGVLDRSVLVRLTVSGTASSDSDYSGVPSYISMAAGQTIALIEVTPKPTAALTEGPKWVQVTIQPDPSYRVMGTESAKVALIQQAMTLALWRQQHFPGTSGDLQTFANTTDQNGIPNLVRYAFGIDGQDVQQSTLRPLFQVQDGRLTVTFHRPVAITDVDYRVEVSSDLSHWHSDSDWVEQFVPPEHADDLETLCYRTRKTLAEAPQQYLRVHVIYAP